eukprot:jgi/Astpho2/7203/Aster-01521
MALLKVALSLTLLAASAYADVPYVNLTYVPGGPTQQVLYSGYTTYQLTKSQAQSYCNTGAPAFPVVDATIDDVHSAMLDGSLTCSQLVENYIQRISAYGPQINAVREVNPDIVAEAAAMDAMLPAYQSGAEEMPLLFCVPMLVKDNFDTMGIATANGAVALLDNFPPQDATAFGVVRNPFDLDRSSAGSSGGPAAGASANFAMISLGSDTGNSIRGPSGHNGLVGIRSSIGQTSRAGIIPLELNRDIGGPIGRSVSDVAKVFTALTDFSMFPNGVDPRDTVTAFRNNYTHPANYTSLLNPNGLEGKRIGVLRSYVDVPFNDPEIVRLFNQAVADLEAGGRVEELSYMSGRNLLNQVHGAEIVDNFTISGNSLGDQEWSGYVPVTTIADNGSIVNTGEYGFNNGSWYVGFGAEGHWESDSADACPNFREDLEAYLSTSGSHYRTLQDIYTDGLFHPTVASSIASYVYQSNFSTSAILQQPASKAANLTCTCGQFFDNPCRVEERARLIESMDADGIDAFIYPGWGNPPRLIGDLDQTGASPLGDFSQGLLPGTGAPGMVVQMGLHANLSTPTALQIGARPFDEATLFEIGYAYEQL